ncbi:MAG TPA: 1,4-alpha-glucan branching protein GlgB [Bryobacteraceae bacterium]|nr:1,4-alpha-glucan branching protein GlgB [Bryobacteraceae bacterium]
MTAAEIEAIVGGYHGDAFRILGPHGVRKREGHGRWVVRAFLPQAESAEVVYDGAGGPRCCPMAKRHEAGFFVAAMTGDPGHYRLRIRLWDGRQAEFEDPYRFGPQLSDLDLHLHAEGTLYEAYKVLGAHPVCAQGVDGVRFAVWAPNAENVTVAGDFNDWDIRRHPMRRRNGGIWELFLPGAAQGASYKYNIRSKFAGYQQLKSDPYAFYCEVPPKSASLVWDLGRYQWNDREWMAARAKRDWLHEPIAIYEVHLESWLRGPGGRPLTYRELAVKLVEYVKRMGYTHIELLPIMEHPFSGSWGYQVIGYFAPTSRFGAPDDFKYFVDSCHQAGIGVIVDWVPGHFPKDAHGLAFFDGTALYEHADWRKGEHREWGTLVFNYARNEVRAFLISNALFWLREYHIEGLRVDAVASMLYLDYARRPGEWIPNQYGGNENLEAIDFLRRFNTLVHTIPGAFTVAEESTAFPGVSKPVYLNGLGFTMKWNMGWMHDMLDYFSKDPVYRKYHHNHITFALLYAFHENFVLPISHDEVVYGKGSLLDKMPGDEWRQFANTRAFLAYMWGHPGKKLLFMGQEIGQREEWNYNTGVRWDLLQFAYHRKLQELIRDLNRLYRSSPALYQADFHPSGFEWVDFHDAENSVIAFIRRAQDPRDFLMFCCNFTPVPHSGYEFGVPEEGFYQEILNTDSALYGGSNLGNGGGVSSRPIPKHGRKHSIAITLPPLAVVVFRKR